MVARWVSHREESPDSKGRALDNVQAEQSDTGTTEIKPPMAERWDPIWSLRLR